jgi:RNA-directed DNA polymerase
VSWKSLDKGGFAPMNTKSSTRKDVYYNFEEIKQTLYKQSTEGKKNFKNLMELIISDENILLAYRTIKSNKGSKTSSTDEMNIIHFAETEQDTFIQNIKSLVLDYKPRKVKRVWIPKANGDKRPLGIPSIIDRLIQQMFLNILEPICEGKFYNHSYGFRPIRTTRHALARVQTLININKLYYTVDIDIKGFFDNVNHSLLLKQLWNIGIKDKRVLAVISKMLKAPISGEGTPKKGVPQGGILSPLLSNVVLNDLDQWVADQWDTFNSTRNTFAQNASKIRTLRFHSNLKQGYIVRYADDFRILTKSYNLAKRWYFAVTQYLKQRLKLDISPEKSKIINLRTNSSEFLGFKIKAVRKGNKYVAFTHLTDNKKVQIKSSLRAGIKKIKENPSAENIMKYNSIVLGTQNYFKYATHVSTDFNDIEDRLLNTLKIKLKKIAKYEYPRNLDKHSTYFKYYTSTRRTYKIGRLYLYPIGQIKTTSNLNFSQSQNPYDGLKSYSWDVEIVKLMKARLFNRSVEYMDNRLSIFSMQKGKCAISNLQLTADLVHCHHKVPVSEGGTDDFKNLIVIHKDIHKLIHATNPETIIKYLKYFKLNAGQIRKLNQLRSLCKLEKV